MSRMIPDDKLKIQGGKTMDDLFFLEAKCVKHNKPFYIRFDKAAGGVWCQTYGVKAVPENSKGTTFNALTIDISRTPVGPQYQCPHCGNKSFVRCGGCGKLTCKSTDTDMFSCAHCGRSGRVTGTISTISGNSGIGQG